MMELSLPLLPTHFQTIPLSHSFKSWLEKDVKCLGDFTNSSSASDDVDTILRSMHRYQQEAYATIERNANSSYKAIVQIEKDTRQDILEHAREGRDKLLELANNAASNRTPSGNVDPSNNRDSGDGTTFRTDSSAVQHTNLIDSSIIDDDVDNNNNTNSIVDNVDNPNNVVDSVDNTNNVVDSIDNTNNVVDSIDNTSSTESDNAVSESTDKRNNNSNNSDQDDGNGTSSIHPDHPSTDNDIISKSINSSMDPDKDDGNDNDNDNGGVNILNVYHVTNHRESTCVAKPDSRSEGDRDITEKSDHDHDDDDYGHVTFEDWDNESRQDSNEESLTATSIPTNEAREGEDGTETVTGQTEEPSTTLVLPTSRDIHDRNDNDRNEVVPPVVPEVRCQQSVLAERRRTFDLPYIAWRAAFEAESQSFFFRHVLVVPGYQDVGSDDDKSKSWSKTAVGLTQLSAACRHRPINANKKRGALPTPHIPNKRRKIRAVSDRSLSCTRRRTGLRTLTAGRKNEYFKRVAKAQAYGWNDVTVPPNKSDDVPRYIRNKEGKSTKFVRYCITTQPKRLEPIQEEGGNDENENEN